MMAGLDWWAGMRLSTARRRIMWWISFLILIGFFLILMFLEYFMEKYTRWGK